MTTEDRAVTEFSDAMLVLFLFGGYIFKNGGVWGAWEDLCTRGRRAVGDRFIAWLDEIEKKAL